MAVHPSHREEDHFLLFVASVLLMGGQVTDESYASSELLEAVRTRQFTLV